MSGIPRSWKPRFKRLVAMERSELSDRVRQYVKARVDALRYRLAGDGKFAREIFNQWQHWHAENPYPVGINWASSLEVAFRSLSWIWTYFLLADSPAMLPGFRGEWLRALSINGRHIENYLSTYFSPNTHLLGEAVALFFIGTVCPEIGAE